MEDVTYYIEGLFRQGNAEDARTYLGITAGGVVNDVDIQFTDNVINNASTTEHGFMPKLSGNPLEFFNGVGSWAVPAGGGITQLTGDVTAGPGSGSQAATIANNAVTYAKMQDVTAAERLIGRGAGGGAGDPQEITLGTNLSMSGTTLNASGGGGTPGGADKNVQYNDAGTFGGVGNNATATNFFLRQVSSGTPAMAQVQDADLLMNAGSSTNDSIVGTHGFLKELSGNESDFMDGTGNWSNPTGGMAVGWFRYDNNTTIADPGAGDFRMNTSSWGTATVLAFDQLSDPGNDVTAMIMMMRSGDQILIQKKNDSTIFGRFTVTATPTNQTGWFSVPVTNVVDSGVMPANTQLCAVVVSYDGGGGAGGITQLTGDVTATGPGVVAATIANNAVTYAKMQDVSAASKLLGRGDSGSGDPQEITLGSNLTMVGTTLDAADFFYTRQDYWCTPNGANTGGLAFNINSTGTAGTFIPPDANHPGEVPITTATAINSIAQWSSTTGGLTLIPYNRTMEYITYIETIESALFAYFVGLSNTTFGVTDTPAGPCALFRYSTSAGDTNWRAYMNNGSTTDNIDTGVAYAANTTLKFELRWDGSTSNKVKFYINNTLVATSTIDFTSTQTFGIINYVITKANPGAKTLRYGGTRMRVTYF